MLGAYALGWMGWISALACVRRIAPVALNVAVLLTLPAWAALGTTQRTAELPAVGTGALVDWAAVDAVMGSLNVVPAPVDSLEGQTDAPVMAAAPIGVVFPPTVARWRELVEGEIAALQSTRGLHEAVTADLVLAVIAAESGGDPAAQSPARAVGLMQVLPTTVASLVPGAGVGSRTSAFDPPLNVRAGILYLDEAVRRHDGDVQWALAAYNAGITASVRARSVGAPLWPESNAFVTRVMATLPRGA